MSIIPVTVIYQLSVVVFDLVAPELSHPAGHEVQLGLVKQLTVGRNNPDLISDNSASKYHRHPSQHDNNNQLGDCQVIGSDQYSCVI